MLATSVDNLVPVDYFLDRIWFNSTFTVCIRHFNVLFSVWLSAAASKPISKISKPTLWFLHFIMPSQMRLLPIPFRIAHYLIASNNIFSFEIARLSLMGNISFYQPPQSHAVCINKKDQVKKMCINWAHTRFTVKIIF